MRGGGEKTSGERRGEESEKISVDGRGKGAWGEVCVRELQRTGRVMAGCAA